MRTNTTKVKAPAFKPSNLITLLGWPVGSYSNSCTQTITGYPNSRKLIFYRFRLVDVIPKLATIMKQHKLYADYDIDVNLTKSHALVITLFSNNMNTMPQLSPRTTKPYNKLELEKLRVIVKNLIGPGFNYRSIPTDAGYEFLFFGVHKSNIRDKVVAQLKKRYPNFTIRGELGGVGLYLFITKNDNGTIPLPYGLKELLPVETVERIVEPVAPVTENVSLPNQIINAIHSLMISGTSIKTIKNELDCSDADMMELLDINSTVVLYDTIKKLGKLSNTTFTI